MTDRKHALLSASGAHRWLICTPSALLEEQFPDTSSEAAREGTLAHELAELKLRHYFHPLDFNKRKLNAGIKKLKSHELWQDEMMAYTDDFLDYVKSVALSLPGVPYVALEKKVDFSVYVPDGFGTADCILIQGDTLIIIDFKYGKSPTGRVEAEANPQLMLYALGAYENFKMFYAIKHIRLAIAQPRLQDGISEWSLPLGELLEFGEFASARAELALTGEGEFSPDVDTCRWCRARAKCRARADENIMMAFLARKEEKRPPLIGNDEVGSYLTQGEDVAAWLSDLKEYALSECLAGREVAGYKAVEGRGSRDWSDMDLAFGALTDKGIAEEILWERKPLSVAQVEKVVGKKDFTNYVGELVVKKPGKPTLVPESDKRDAITNKITAQEAFKED